MFNIIVSDEKLAKHIHTDFLTFVYNLLSNGNLTLNLIFRRFFRRTNF